MQGQLRTSQTKMTDQTAVWLLCLSVISFLIRLAGVQMHLWQLPGLVSYKGGSSRYVLWHFRARQPCGRRIATDMPAIYTHEHFMLIPIYNSILTSALLFALSSPYLHCTPWHWIISPLCLRNLPKTWLVKSQRRILVPSITAETLIYGKVYGSRMILDMPCRCKPISLLINLFWSFRSRLPSRYLRRLRMTFAGDLKYDYNKNQHFRALYIYCFD